MQGLKGKVAICTGSGRRDGLGAAILRRLAAEGCDVVVSDLGTPDRMLGAGDIGASDERSPVADDQHGLRGVLLRRRDCVVDALPNRMRQSVDRGIVDGNHADIIDELVADGRSHYGPLIW